MCRSVISSFPIGSLSLCSIFCIFEHSRNIAFELFVLFFTLEHWILLERGYSCDVMEVLESNKL